MKVSAKVTKTPLKGKFLNGEPVVRTSMYIDRSLEDLGIDDAMLTFRIDSKGKLASMWIDFNTEVHGLNYFFGL